MTTKKQPKPKKFRTKSITKAKLLFMYIICAGIASFLYAISCPFTGYSLWYAAIPYSLLILYGIGVFIWKNWKMIWVFIQNVERGRLLMFLNANTHFDYAHKMKVIEWVYPRKNSIRKEQHIKLLNKYIRREDDLKDFESIKYPKELNFYDLPISELSNSQKKLLKKKVVYCPQQLLDGFNKTMLINALIYSHERIQVLDDELRDILELTDENMKAFDIYVEIAKIKEPCLN